MISILKDFTPIAAASLLSRAGFALDEPSNPAANAKLDDELNLRQEIYREIRGRLGIAPEDESDVALGRIGDEIDLEISLLTVGGDPRATLAHLSEEGRAPSDIYLVRVVENVEDLYKKKWPLEHDRIKSAVFHADREEHYGPSMKVHEKGLISIFLKYFPNPNPHKCFSMIVVGQREDLILNVHQAWHLYDDSVQISQAGSLVDVLRQFVAVFGVDISVDGVRAKFWLRESKDLTAGSTTSIEILPQYKHNGKGKKVLADTQSSISVFFTNNPETKKSSEIAFAIDLNKYQLALKRHGW